MAADASTGIKPEYRPVTFGEKLLIGWQGSSKVDCVTVWFFGANWNCTMSPTGTVRSEGEKVKVPFEPPTLTTWTVT